MQEKESHKVGKEVAQRLWGKERAEKLEAVLESFSPGFHQFVLECFSVYDRPTLDPKTRSLCTVAVLTALGRAEQLRLHISGALNNGASEEEIRELLWQVAIYAGVPAAINAFIIANKIFERRRSEQG